jgi:hypothetical protein
MPLKLNSSGGGSVLLQEPSTASNRTLTLPDATTTAVGTDATQTLSNKTFSGAQTFGTASFAEPSGSAPLYLARAWVNFNGSGTVAIRGSGNVTSITDNGVGNYTVNFTTAMPDTNYSCNFGVGGGGSGLTAGFVGTVLTTTQYGTASNKTTSVVQFTTVDYTATVRDLGEIYVSIFR